MFFIQNSKGSKNNFSIYLGIDQVKQFLFRIIIKIEFKYKFYDSHANNL